MDGIVRIVLSFAIVLTAFWLVSAGILAIYAAIQERRIGVGWGWTMTFGILAVAACVIAFMNPGVTLAWIMGLISAYAIIAGIVQLVGAGKMGSLQRDVKGTMEDRDRTDQRHAALGLHPCQIIVPHVGSGRHGHSARRDAGIKAPSFRARHRRASLSPMTT